MEINKEIDSLIKLGPIGSVHVKTTIKEGCFEFAGANFAVPSYMRPDTVDCYCISEPIAAYLADDQNWLNWVYNGFMLGIDTEEEIGEILADNFKLSYESIAQKTTKYLKYNPDQLARCLKGAGATPEEAADIMMHSLRYPSNIISKAFSQYFTYPEMFASSKTSSTVHTDITPHDDIPAQHTDISDPGSHTDQITTPHTDEMLPHDDSTYHYDQ